MSLDPIFASPRVICARRCTYIAGYGSEPTRQVMVAFRDGLPNLLDLGSWDVFPVRRYTPKSPRCFMCQTSGYVQKHYRARELCAICSGRHPISECVDHAVRGGERRTSRCTSCGKGHHTWSKLCSQRLWRLPPSSKDKKADRNENMDTRSLPAAHHEGSHEVSQRSSALVSRA